MIVIRMDRRVLWGIAAVLLILVALAAGVFIGSMTSGGGTGVAAPPAAVQQAPAQQAPIQQSPLQPQAQAQQPSAPSNMALITVDEAKQLVGQPNVVFVDARVVDEYKKLHIKGAVSMPNTEVAQRFQELPRDKDLIIYCA